MKKAILLFSIFCALQLSSQSISVVQEQSTHYSQLGVQTDSYWDSLLVAEGASNQRIGTSEAQGSCSLNKRVFGWHPYWMGPVYNNYQWNLLSDLCYFDYAVSSNTGNNTNSSYNWLGSGAVTAAISNGVDVHICATLFSSHTTFLASTTAQNTFIANIISDLQARGGKGVNIDFEGMGSSNSAAFTAFIQNLSNQLHTQIPGSELSMALYAVDWGNVFDIPNLTPYVDLFIIMGYDYYWSGSSTAGPDDPLYNFETSYNRTLTRSITFYLAQGMPENKLLLGLPYYGREWETVGSTIPSATTGNFSSSRTYSVIRNNANGYYNTPLYDPVSFTPYYSFQVSSAWRQCFWENLYSMKRRYDVVNQRNLGGIGIWALGYDDGYPEYWQAIEDKFSNCAILPCTDTIWDMGGPSRNYYANEDYTTTISPDGATSVTLAFSQFDVELNFDTLFIYDGPNAASPILGTYTGTNSPGTVVSSGPSLSFRFQSDGNTTRPGFTAIWSCTIDNTIPTTQIASPSGWITQDFVTTFTDSDNGGSGIEKSYYQTAAFNGNEWRSNNSRGFFNDDFNTGAIHPEWTQYSGTWNVLTGVLEQSDELNANTGISASLTQSLSNRYLYHWQGKIDGTGNNRRAGLHFFADNPALPNRGNGYFVWFRADQSQLQFYEVINDVFTLQATFPMTVNAGQWYDWKVVYDRITGVMEVYQNNAFIGAWTDASPHATGNCVSFRSGDCKWQIDNFHVYRSRYSNLPLTVTVGNCTGCDFSNENTSPAFSAGLIRSINRDSVRLFSIVASYSLDVDWTCANFAIPLDGNAVDIDATANLSLIEGNWQPATDTNSGIAQYWYCIGTTPGDSDFVSWTASVQTSFSLPTTLVVGQWYYIGLRVENGAVLITPIDTSDGQVADLGLGIEEMNSAWTLYPNPAGDVVSISNSNQVPFHSVNIYDESGKLVMSKNNSSGAVMTIDISNLAIGGYTIEVIGSNLHAVTPFIKN